MRTLLAKLFRVLFRIKQLRARYFGFYQKLFKPYNLFKGVTCNIKHNGFRLVLRIDDWIQQNIYFLGGYSVPELKVIDRFLNQGAVFIDVGTNIGIFTLYASKLVENDGKVISFEPFSKNFDALAKHLQINNILNVKPEKIALGNANEKATIFYDPSENNLGMVSLTPMENGIKEEISIVRLDSYLKDNPEKRIDLIKIDVEGHELDALLGMEQTLKTYKPALLVEILEAENDRKAKEGLKTELFLSKIGYNKYFIGDCGSISEVEINPGRRNYIFSTRFY